MKMNSARPLLKVAIALAVMLPLFSQSAVPLEGIGQTKQMVSPVEYDPEIFDLFFDEVETSWPWWIVDHGDGTFEDTRGHITKIEDIPVLTHTADCRTRHQGLHQIKFSHARLLKDGAIKLKIEDESASTWDSLTIHIDNGRFSSHYKTRYPADPPDIGLIWTTTKQRLVLEKKNYKKGDVIKGRIEFECVQEATNPKYGGRNPRKIRIEGPFKPTLQLE
jgi:hypothetical protein